jgi:hypothetical protein
MTTIDLTGQERDWLREQVEFELSPFREQIALGKVMIARMLDPDSHWPGERDPTDWRLHIEHCKQEAAMLRGLQQKIGRPSQRGLLSDAERQLRSEGRRLW